jgi:hypothetical protein
MKSNSFTPVSIIISFCDDREDGWEISACGNANKKKEDMESGIALSQLEPKEDETRANKPDDHRPFKSPCRSYLTCDQQGNAITYSKGSEESTCLPMGEGKGLLDQGEDGGEDGSCGKVKEPETPEDKKGKKIHYFTRFKPGGLLPWRDGPSSLPFFLLNKFSLKRLFFMLTALMMQ